MASRKSRKAQNRLVRTSPPNRNGSLAFYTPMAGAAVSTSVQKRCPQEVVSVVSSPPIRCSVRVTGQIGAGAVKIIHTLSIAEIDALNYTGSVTVARYGLYYPIEGRCWLTTQDGTTATTTTLGPPQLRVTLPNSTSSAAAITMRDIGTPTMPAKLAWRWPKVMQQTGRPPAEEFPLVTVSNDGLAAKTFILDIQFVGAF